MEYVREIRFSEKPNYYYIKEQLKIMYEDNSFEYDNKYDWIVKKSLEGNEIKFASTVRYQKQYVEKNYWKDKNEKKLKNTPNNKDAQLLKSTNIEDSSLTGYIIHLNSLKVTREYATERLPGASSENILIRKKSLKSDSVKNCGCNIF